MFETAYTMKITKNFMHDLEGVTEGKDVNVHSTWDDGYHDCWKGIKRLFDPKDPEAGYKKYLSEQK